MPHIVGIALHVGQAVTGTAVNGLYSRSSWSGATSGCVAAAAGLWLRRRDRTHVAAPRHRWSCSRPATSSSGATGSASGFAYLSGPVYFIPLFVPLCIFIATALIALWRRRRGLLIVLCCVLVVATVPFLYDKSAMNHRISDAQEPWQRGDRRRCPASRW